MDGENEIGAVEQSTATITQTKEYRHSKGGCMHDTMSFLPWVLYLNCALLFVLRLLLIAIGYTLKSECAASGAITITILSTKRSTIRTGLTYYQNRGI